MDRTLVIIKPNAVQRGLAGEFMSRFERRGFRISALVMTTIEAPLARIHYAEHEGMPFFEDLIAFMTSGPSIVMVLEAPGAVTLVRSMVGDTNPSVAHPGTIRGDYAMTTRLNMIHASDSESSAEREIALFFGS